MVFVEQFQAAKYKGITGAIQGKFRENTGDVKGKYRETSLLRRLQAQTLPDATPPTRKIRPLSRIAVTQRFNFYVLRNLKCPKPVQHSLFYNWKNYL